MPFVRGTYTTHPATGEAGLWVELSTSPRGVLTGLAKTAWPNIVTTGPVGNRDTPATYSVKVAAAVNNLCRKVLNGVTSQVVVVTVNFSSLSPITLAVENGFVVADSDCVARKAGA